MKHILLITTTLITILLLLPVMAGAATYNWYFDADAVNDTGAGTELDPWKTLAKVQTQINTTASADVVNIYFDRGDTWTFGSGTPILQFPAANGVVTISAYGTGALPILDGEVDFDSLPSGRNFYDAVFWVKKAGCTIEYLEVKRNYGTIMYLYTGNLTVRHCKFHDYGWTGIGAESSSTTSNCVIQYNEFYNTCELHRVGNQSGWTGAVYFTWGQHANNTVRYNKIYNASGEGIAMSDGLVEYNVLWNLYSSAFQMQGSRNSPTSLIVRYNIAFGFGSPTSGYRRSYVDDRWWNGPGINIDDEFTDGSNVNWDVEVYGNVFIGMVWGVQIHYSNNNSDALKSLKVYNNTLIDNYNNIYADDPTKFSSVEIYNNSSIKYDITTAHVTDYQDFLPHANWTIENNAFWTTGGTPTVDADWQTDYVTTDPKLLGEAVPVDWDGLTGIGDIDFDTHLYLDADSGLIDTGATLGAGYATTFLTIGTDFAVLPETVTITTIAQGDWGVAGAWDIGAVIYKGAGSEPPDAAEEACTGDCFFASSWEDGAGVLNTGHTYVWDSVSDAVNLTLDTSSFFDDGSCITWDSGLDYVTEGGALNKSTIYVRGAFQITGGIADGDYNALFGFYDSVNDNFAYMRLENDADASDNYYVVGRVYDHTEGGGDWVYITEDADQTVLPTGLVELATNVEYQAELYMTVGTGCGFRIWNSTGTLIWPTVGDWEVMPEGVAFDPNEDGTPGDDIDTIFAGNYVDKAGGGDVDQVQFSGSAIGFSTKIGGSPTITAIGTATVTARVVTFSANTTETETAIGNPGWYFALQLSEQLGPYASPDPSALRWDSGPATADDVTGYSDAPYYGHLPDAGGTYYLLYNPDLKTLYRGSHPQAYGDGSAALIANDATLEDGDGNPLDTDFNALGTDLDGTGTITWGAATTITFGTGGDVSKPSILMSQFNSDAWYALSDITDNITFTADTIVFQGSRYSLTGTVTFNAGADNNVINCLDISGAVTDNGTGNLVREFCPISKEIGPKTYSPFF